MKLVILGRDGVINEDVEGGVTAPEAWQPLAGSIEAIVRLNRAGFRVVVASNQSGLGRGLFDVTTLLRIHDKMHRTLAAQGGAVDAVFFCPHTAADQCACRKPKPGMLLDIAARLQTELTAVPVIGARLRDAQAARAVGARPLLVRSGKNARQTLQDTGDVPVYDDLAAAVAALLNGADTADGAGR